MVQQQFDGSVEFRFFHPEARSVRVVGDFNAWRDDCMPMERSPVGYWICHLRLAPGIYQFRYRSDGEWFLDYAAFGLEVGPFGWNSVLLVRDSLERAGDEVTAGRGRESLVPALSIPADVKTWH